MKSKKGFTLIELICALVIVSVALLFGLQLFTVGAKGYGRSAVLDADTAKIVRYFETNGTLPVNDAKTQVTQTLTDGAIKITLSGNKVVTIALPQEMETVEIQNEKTKTSLSTFKLAKG
ncbi:MAG: type II secretion system protein [Ruthenibacterium sp.]